jgi:hypothetical protein
MSLNPQPREGGDFHLAKTGDRKLAIDKLDTVHRIGADGYLRRPAPMFYFVQVVVGYLKEGKLAFR